MGQVSWNYSRMHVLGTTGVHQEKGLLNPPLGQQFRFWHKITWNVMFYVHCGTKRAKNNLNPSLGQQSRFGHRLRGIWLMYTAVLKGGMISLARFGSKLLELASNRMFYVHCGTKRAKNDLNPSLGQQSRFGHRLRGIWCLMYTAVLKGGMISLARFGRKLLELASNRSSSKRVNNNLRPVFVGPQFRFGDEVL